MSLHNACLPALPGLNPRYVTGAGMDMTGADRQRRYRARRKQDHAALLDQLAALQVCVAQLEAELVARPPAGPKAAPSPWPSDMTWKRP